MGLNELKSAALSGAAMIGEYGQANRSSANPLQTGGQYGSTTYSPPTRSQIDVDPFQSLNAASSGNNHGMNGGSADATTKSHISSPDLVSALPATVEEKMVSRFVSKTSQGVRVAPSTEECRKFLASCKGLRPTSLAKALEKSLGNGTWKDVLRALCVLDAAAAGIGGETSTSLVNYFQKNSQSLHRACQSAHDRVSSRAVSVLSRMGMEVPQAEEQKQAASAGGMDLLSMDKLNTDGKEERKSGEHVVEKIDILDDDGNLPSLLASLDVQDDSPASRDPPLFSASPGSPIIGLISNESNKMTPNESKLDDPFGDWLDATGAGAAQPSETLMLAKQTMPKDPFSPTEPTSCVEVSDTRDSPLLVPSSQPSMIPVDFFATPPPDCTSPLTVSSGHSNTPVHTDVIGAWHATTSGFTSTEREEKAFDFVGDVMKRK